MTAFEMPYVDDQRCIATLFIPKSIYPAFLFSKSSLVHMYLVYEGLLSNSVFTFL